MNESLKNINRLAVILVGEFRTWPIASKYLFNFFEKRANQVDYFFVTWNVTSQTGELISVTDSDILEPFNTYGQNLVSYKILEPIGRHSTTFYNQAWLSKIANILKRQNEIKNNIVYDQVVETRPDCYYRSSDTPWYNCKEYEYEGACPKTWASGLLGISDVYFRTTSATHDLISDRYNIRRSSTHTKLINETHWEFTNHHWVMTELLYKRLLHPVSHNDTGDFSFFCCIRPNFSKELDLDSEDCLVLDEMFIGWGKPHKDFFYGPESDLPMVDIDK